MMDIQQNDDGKNGMFYVQQDNKTLAEMTYTWIGSVGIIIGHTEIDDTLAGKGIGEEMVSKAVNFARQKGIRIIPYCKFAKAVFDKVKEFKDVL